MGAWTGRRITVSLGSVVALAAGFIGGGFFHCVHGGNVGFTVVAKEDWGYYDQFVDLDDIVGRPLLTLLDRARTVRALIRAGVVEPPNIEGPTDPATADARVDSGGLAVEMCACRDDSCAKDVAGRLLTWRRENGAQAGDATVRANLDEANGCFRKRTGEPLY